MEQGKKFFTQCGVSPGDAPGWLRRNCLALSMQTGTGIAFWLGLSLPELGEWIEAFNEARQRREDALNRQNL